MTKQKSLDTCLNQVIRADVRKMSAYKVQDASGLIKLDAMENPYPWPGNLPGWLDAMTGLEVNRYPDPTASAVVSALRNVMNIPDRYGVVLGNGSDELIQLLIQCIGSEKALVLSPEPSFVMYRVLAQTNRVDYKGIPLLDNFQLDLPNMLDAINQLAPQLIFLACPNNPTGIRYNEHDIRQLIEATPGLVVIDEAYIAFSDADALPLLDDYPNLLIMRTLSKVGLAGLRLGILIGLPEWITEIDKIRLPYNINTLTQSAALFALRNYRCLDDLAKKIRASRNQMVTALNHIPLTKVWPSEANFVLIKTKPGKAQGIFNNLKNNGVLIKCLDGAHPLLEDCLRLTVGTTEENELLLNLLNQATVKD